MRELCPLHGPVDGTESHGDEQFLTGLDLATDARRDTMLIYDEDDPMFRDMAEQLADQLDELDDDLEDWDAEDDRD